MPPVNLLRQQDLRPTIPSMKLVLRSIDRSPLGTVEIDDSESPSRVTTHLDREVFLDWSGARDDQRHLRRCPACGFGTLFRLRRLPQVTGFIIVAALAMALAAVLGLATSFTFFVVMLALLVLDLGILLAAPQSLECPRCRSSYRNTPIAKYHPKWNARAVAELLNASDENASSSRDSRGRSELQEKMKR